MLRLRDFMTRNVLALEPDDSLRDAIDLFSSNHITGAPVVDDGTVVGVISFVDVMDLAAATVGAPPPDLPEAWTDDDDEDTANAGRDTASYFTHPWPVADPDALAEFGRVNEHHGDTLDDMTVADAMTRHIAELPPETGLQDAARFMLDRGIHRVLVVADGQLEGLVTTTDFMRLIAEGRCGPARIDVMD
jgi:CBS domain-containing protein